MKTVLDTVQDCRKVFKDIVDGCTYIKSPLECYVKHFSESDLGLLENKNEFWREMAEESGLIPEKQALQVLDKLGHWDKNDEEDYQNLLNSISDLEQAKRNLADKSQATLLFDTIKKRQDTLEKISSTRNSLLRISSDNFIGRKTQEEMLKYSIYKDRECKIPLYSPDEFEELEPQQINLMFGIYSLVYSSFNEKNLKKIAVCPFFLNLFALANDDIYIFYGKPVLDLTINQINLFNLGKMNRAVLNHINDPIKDPDLDKVVNWFEAEYALLVSKSMAANKQQ